MMDGGSNNTVFPGVGNQVVEGRVDVENDDLDPGQLPLQLGGSSIDLLVEVLRVGVEARNAAVFVLSEDGSR